jgi:type IV secretory pathway VirB2 component (pilin)
MLINNGVNTMKTFISSFSLDEATAWKLCVSMCVLALMVILPEGALAQATTTTATGPNAIESGLCNMIAVLNGPVGKGVATVAIFFVGVALFMGKMSWSVALAVGLGVAAIFGAESIIETISPDAASAGSC